jgi:hypothetical protein
MTEGKNVNNSKKHESQEGAVKIYAKIRGRHYERYSVIAIMLHYVFALLHNALYLWRIVNASDSYGFRLCAGVTAYDSYRSELAGQRYRFASLSFLVTYASAFASREVTALICR